MPTRIHGAASMQQNLAGDLQFYIVYSLSPGAFTDPSPNPPEIEETARQINIQVTDDILDQSQKNFEILFQSIGLRAVPTIMNNPEPVLNLETEGAPSLTGEGYVWRFAVERADAWKDFKTDDPVGLLVRELDGVIIESGVRITTVDGSLSGTPKNMEFIRVDKL
jgi:hypothetical protein